MRALKTVLFFALSLVAAPARSGETITHHQPRFRLTVPDGFVPVPDHIKGKELYAFARALTSGEKVPMVITVGKLGGLIGREKLDAKQVAENTPSVTLSTEKWRGFEIEVLRTPLELGEVPAVVLGAQIPLAGEAIQVSILGEESREVEVRGILRSVLANLEGESNWRTPAEHVTRESQGVSQLAIAVGVVVVIMVVLKVTRKRKDPRRSDDR